MSKKFMVVLLVCVALVATGSALAYQWTERNAPPPAAKDKPEDKYAPGPAGNPYKGSPQSMRGQLSEGFEGGAIPADWTVYDNDGDGYQWEAYDATGTTIGPHSGTYVARVHYNYAGCDDWLITPKLVCDAATDDTLKFWAASYSSYYLEDFEVRVSTTGNDIPSFGAPVYSVTSHPNAWQEHKIPLDAYDGNNVYVAVVCTSVDEFYLYVDDFSGPEIWVPAGPAIDFNTTSLDFGTVVVNGKDSKTLPLIIYSVGGSDLTVSNVVSDNAHFTHDFPGTTVIPPGDSLVVQVTFTPTAEPEETGTLTITHDATKAESYISMSGSGFVGLLYEDFSGTFPPSGWAEYQLGDPAGWQQGTPGYDDTYCAFHNDDNVTTLCDDWLVTPQITLPAKATYELEFMQYENYESWYYYHGIMISTGSGVPPTDFVELLEVGPGTEDTWEAVEDISLAAYAGQNIYLAFRYMGDYADEWSVDNVVVQEYVYVNEPPEITHDPKGDTDDTTPTITAIITDVEGFTASVYYETAPKAFTQVAMTSTGVLPNEYSADLPVGSYGTVNYYIEAVDDSGLVSTDPAGAPTNYYSFDICPIVGDEIVYDDGTVENATCWNPGYTHGRFAVRFTAPAYPCTLTAVKLGIATDWPDDPHQMFAVEVYDDDGTGGAPSTLLYGPDTTGSIGNVVGGFGPFPELQWAYVCINPPMVFTEGDFYVAKEQFQGYPDCEGLDIDEDGVQYSRSWEYNPSTYVWEEYYPGSRNLMIRAYTSQVIAYGAIGGTVSEAKGPIQDAIVTAEGPITKSDTTDVNGEYLIEDLNTGTYDVTATATGYVSQTQEDVVVTAGDTTIVDFALTPWGVNDVLVVDADGSYYLPDAFTDVQAYFTDALTACGYTYDVWEKTDQPQDGPDHTIMELYDAVVWFTGEAWQNSQTLTATDEAELATYLDGGGKLFLSAHDYFYDRYPAAGSFSPGQFPYDYLGVTSTTQDVVIIVDPETGTATGYAGSVAEGLSYDLYDPYTTTKPEDKGGDDGLYIDELVINGDAVFSADHATEPEHADIAACQYESGPFKTVFTTVSFAGLVDGVHTRAELMCSIMDWLLAPPAQMWLSNGGVDPIIGSLSTTFTYSVTYTQLGDLPPTVKNVYIDGGAHAMTDPTGGSGPYSGGVVFTYDHQFTGGGNHDFYFYFEDGINTDRLPATGTYWGPMNGYYNWHFEDAAHFTPTGPADDWQYGSPTSGPGAAHSGDYCWGTVLAGDYNVNSQSRLETPPLDFTTGGGSTLELKFWHWYDIETGWDGGNVKVITASDTTIIYPDSSQADPYDDYSINTANAWIPGEPGYTGHVGVWKEAVFDLLPWTNESNVKIAFDFGSDGSVTYPGWYIDDVVIWGEPPLPVEMAGFTATAGDGMVRLSWETRSELSNLGFEVYRRVEDGELVRITDERIPGAGTSEDVHTYTYVDRGLTNGTTYYYQLAAVDFGGNVRMHDVVVSATPTAVLPKAFVLSQNYPNPFNPYTEIKYQIPQDSRVVLKIYNVMGQEVVTLVDADLKAGYYTATWNTRDSQGSEVAAGIYFCTMKAGQFSATKKMVLIK